ncbi:golgin a7 [Moniliophthora roreri]|nr:golgin a7 [Moniliophthora roreri]
MTSLSPSDSISDDSIAQLHSLGSSSELSATIGSVLREGESRRSGDGPKDTVRVSQQDVLPSPPLTRSNTGESRVVGTLTLDTTKSEEEKDLGDDDWEDPLRRPNTEEDVLEISQTMGTDLDGGDSVVDANGRLRIPDSNDEKSSSPRPKSDLRIDIRPPPTPQPWDLVDPPPENGQKASNHFGTVRSNNFSTLQKRSRSLIPKSSYYFGPPPPGSAYGTPPVGQIGVHHPREVLRVERDYTGGELIQFAPIYPLELEGRITPTQFLESINAINERLISAHSLRWSLLDNMLAILSLQLTRLFLRSHYEKEMQKLEQLFKALNSELYNPVGLNLLWPRKVAFLFLEIEYYHNIDYHRLSLLLPPFPSWFLSFIPSILSILFGLPLLLLYNDAAINITSWTDALSDGNESKLFGAMTGRGSLKRDGSGALTPFQRREPEAGDERRAWDIQYRCDKERELYERSGRSANSSPDWEGRPRYTGTDFFSVEDDMS